MNFQNRRRFLGNATASSMLLNLKLASLAAGDTQGAGNDRKTLVCINFPGGIDGYHLLVPRDEARHAEYATSRSNLHLPVEGSLGAYRKAIVPLTEEDGGNGSDLYGMHSDASLLADMFNGAGAFEGNRNLSFVANVGSLIKPLTMEAYRAGRIGEDSPIGLASHAAQAEQWQTTIPQGTADLRGWLGRAADIMQSSFNRENSSMNIALKGHSLAQTGEEARPLNYNSGVPLGLTGDQFTDADHFLAMKNLMHRRLMGLEHNDYVERAFSEVSGGSLDLQIQMKEAVASFDESRLVADFPIRSGVSRQLKDALILIATREKQGLCRQTFFINADSWDTHGDLLEPFSKSIKRVAEAISAFQQNLIGLGLQDSVIGFSTSEFARTLRSTGNGSDHAWGGPQFVFGGPIEGGKIFDPFPSLALDGDDDIGRGGRILPSRSCDEYFAKLLRWFGVSEDQLDIVLPNYDNFRGRAPLNFIINS